MIRIILVLILVVSSLLASSVEYDEAYKTYKSGEYRKALEDFKVLVEMDDDSDAAYIIGHMYENGEGCNLDKAEANRWYKKASTSYYSKNRHDVDKEVTNQYDVLYDSLTELEDKETMNTLYQFTHSIFNLKAHKTNYLLPMAVKINGNYDDITDRDTDSTEIEFQISVKYDFAPDLLGFGEIYTVAYTQQSFWQYFVGDAYFRASDYNPEIFVTVPMNTEYFKAIRVSIAHRSNGLGLPDERAWQYAALSTFFQYKSIFTELQVWHRFKDGHDYNPDLIKTMGHGHIKFTLPYKKHFATALFRYNFNDKGAIDTSYSYPLFGDALFLYIKGFVGYGESMIAYAGAKDEPDTHHNDEYVQKIGIGFSLSR